jgi:hypothetical protein
MNDKGSWHEWIVWDDYWGVRHDRLPRSPGGPACDSTAALGLEQSVPEFDREKVGSN